MTSISIAQYTIWQTKNLEIINFLPNINCLDLLRLTKFVFTSLIDKKLQHTETQIQSNGLSTLCHFFKFTKAKMVNALNFNMYKEADNHDVVS